ncbi:DeoR/GlpR family DNA-binding transcription regulator [Bradyrhizobium sp. HKCCYLS20291]|uniref:DeoR/GlpR family DNA-binding transcription regulator n=1 Tax=Bradyrhizobium sp. HKCCYLS20291 TaxID=3420766 RepID=UPI003EB7E742
MLERERFQIILRMAADLGVVPIGDLVAATGASAATIRRDVAELAASGQIRRVHGGVEALDLMQPHTLATRAFDVSQTLNIHRKRAIARAATDLCVDGESIIINAGTTTFQMVEWLASRRLHILTNSYPMAQELIARSDNRIVLPGGEVYRKQGIIVSPFDDDAIQHYSASKMFMSCASIGPMGLIEGDPLIARAEAKLLRRAQELIVLADHSKFDARGAIAVCPLSRVSKIITDDRAPQAAIDMCSSAGIEVIVVPTVDTNDKAVTAA